MILSSLFLRHRWAPFLLAGIAAPLFLTQCKTTAGSYRDIEYDPVKLKTPDGHGLEKKEYPFDDQGNYRKDWVKNKSGGRARSSYKNTQSVSTLPVTEVAEAGPTSYPNYQDLAGVASTASPPAPAPAPAPSSPQYHIVVSGDTLFSLARRYKTSVDGLKRTNGLTGDSIRTGQTLRIP